MKTSFKKTSQSLASNYNILDYIINKISFTFYHLKTSVPLQQSHINYMIQNKASSSNDNQFFSAVTQKRVQIKTRDAFNHPQEVEVTMPPLIFFGLMFLENMQFIAEKAVLLQQVDSKKRSLFIRAQLEHSSDIQKILNKYDLKVAENNELKLSICKMEEYKEIFSIASCKAQDKKEVASQLRKERIQFIFIQASGKFVCVKSSIQGKESFFRKLQFAASFDKQDQRKLDQDTYKKKCFFNSLKQLKTKLVTNQQLKYFDPSQAAANVIPPKLQDIINKQPLLQNAYLQKLDNFIIKVKNADFTNIGLFFSTTQGEYSQFEKDLLFIIENWNIYGQKLEQKMQSFQDHIDFKVNTMSQFPLIYPNVAKIMKKIELTNQYKGTRRSVMTQVSDDITDTLYIHYIQQLEAKTLRHSPFYIKDEKSGNKLLLADVIADKTEYETQNIQNAYWQDIFSRARINVRRQAVSNNLSDDKLNKDMKAFDTFANDIEKERLIDLRCISCCPIFYTDTNIFDPIVNKTPIEIVQKITKLPDLGSDLKNKICYLLNTQGGVILFDVQRKYRDYIPMGEIFTKKDQQSYIQKLEAIIETISPKPQIGENIEITFVPLVKNPMVNVLSQKKEIRKPENSFDIIYYQRPYVEGMFVTRIKVKPTNPWKTYYWINGQKIIVPQKINSLTFKHLDEKKIFSFMKQRFLQNYIPQDLSEQEKQERMLFAPRVSCFHPGKCANPDGGNPLYEHKIPKILEQSPQLKFTYMSLLIARKNDHATIKERLRRRGIDCEIVNLYKQHNFKAANNSAAIYHSIRFDHLLSQISYNRDFEFAGRYAMVVYIAEFLKLPDYNSKNFMTLQSFNNLQSWVRKFHPKESLKFWRYDNGNEEEFYLQTESKLSTVLMYYVMTQFGEKCIFKNPRNYDRLTPQEKQKRIKVYYPLSNLRSSYNESNYIINRENFLQMQDSQEMSQEQVWFYEDVQEDFRVFSKQLQGEKQCLL